MVGPLLLDLVMLLLVLAIVWAGNRRERRNRQREQLHALFGVYVLAAAEHFEPQKMCGDRCGNRAVDEVLSYIRAIYESETPPETVSSEAGYRSWYLIREGDAIMAYATEIGRSPYSVWQVNQHFQEVRAELHEIRVRFRTAWPNGR